MYIIISCKFRIYPNKTQEELVQKTFGCVRYVYNYYLSMRKSLYETKKERMNYFSCSADMTILKREKEWLRVADSSALQSSIKNLDVAYEHFFRGIKNGKKIGYPKFKSKRDRCSSYTSKRVKLCDGHIKLPRIGMVKCRVSKQIAGRVLSVTISQTPSGKYFAAIIYTDVEIFEAKKTGNVIGIDLGIKELATTSNGCCFENPKHYYKSQKKLAKLQKRLSRKPKDSNNWNKARTRVAYIHEHIANQRLDNTHKMTTALVRDYDSIFVETLGTKNMIKNKRLAKVISDAAWGEIVRQLEYKCNWYGKKLIKVDRFYPSSQICSSCGFKNEETRNLSIRKWDCPQCGASHNRDVNAAKNILKEGTRIISAV